MATRNRRNVIKRIRHDIRQLNARDTELSTEADIQHPEECRGRTYERDWVTRSVVVVFCGSRIKYGSMSLSAGPARAMRLCSAIILWPGNQEDGSESGVIKLQLLF